MNSPIRLILKWAGPDRKYLIAAVVFAFVSGLMAMVPYYGVYQIMVAAYEGTCTWQVIKANATLVAVGAAMQGRRALCGGVQWWASMSSWGLPLKALKPLVDRLCQLAPASP